MHLLGSVSFILKTWREGIPIFCATYTGSSFPSTSFLFNLTRISTLQRQHRTLSDFWQTQPRFAHSTSLTLAGFGVQSVRFENDFRRFRNSARSQGAYFGVSVEVGCATEADFLWTIVAIVLGRVREEDIRAGIEVELLIRRFLA